MDALIMMDVNLIVILNSLKVRKTNLVQKTVSNSNPI